LFHASGAHGIHPSELSPLGRHPSVSVRMNPHTVSPTGDASTKGEDQPDRPQFLGFNPPESPWQPDTCLARPPLDAPLGFTLPGHSGESFAEVSPGLLSRASAQSGTSPLRSAPQSVNQPPLGLGNRAPQRPTAKTTLVEFLRRHAPERESLSARWLCVHLPPRHALLPTDRRS